MDLSNVAPNDQDRDQDTHGRRHAWIPTGDERVEILHTQQSDERWRALRTYHITGSLGGVVLGLDPYRSRASAWAEICHNITPTPNGFARMVMEWGKKMEAPARAVFSSLTGETVYETGIVRRRDGPDFLRSSPDGVLDPCAWIQRNRGRKIRAILEIKCRWTAFEMPDELRTTYLIQDCINIFCTRSAFAVHVVYKPPRPLRLFLVYVPSSAWLAIERGLRSFWEKYCAVKRSPPRMRRGAKAKLDAEIRDAVLIDGPYLLCGPEDWDAAMSRFCEMVGIG